jgi:methionyl-tRNA synthetase
VSTQHTGLLTNLQKPIQIGGMYYITTPIPYANGKPHLGHLLEAITTDTFARYQRRKGLQVRLQMGVDQNGLKIFEKAHEEGVQVQKYVDKVTQDFQQLWKTFEIQHDAFIETSKPYHKIVSQAIWKLLEKTGSIYKKTYSGLYCTGCEDFYAPSQLVDGNCPIHGTKPIEMEEENYFFKLSDYKTQILEFLKTADIRPAYIAKEYANFTQDVQDISISRDSSRLPWGVEVPGDNTQVMYVWFEALINYLTAVVDGETLDEVVEFPHLADEKLADIFSEIRDGMPIDLMYISKEVAKFHVVVFIGMLSALQFALPKQVLAHGLINDGQGRKFSKTLGNGVYPQELVEKFGVDGTRYIMLHDVNIDGDTNFDWKTITESYNAGLANVVGNLLMRVTTLIEKHLNGVVDIADVITHPYDMAKVYENMELLNPKEAIEQLLNAARWGNEQLEQKRPWTMIKEGDIDGTRIVLTDLAVLLRDIAEGLSLFLPESGEKMYVSITKEIITKAEPLFQKVELTDPE